MVAQPFFLWEPSFPETSFFMPRTPRREALRLEKLRNDGGDFLPEGLIHVDSSGELEVNFPLAIFQENSKSEASKSQTLKTNFKARQF